MSIEESKLDRLIFGLYSDLDHQKMVKRTFWITVIYSIVYGIYEHFVVYTGVRLIDYIPAQANWAMMYTLIVLLNYRASGGDFHLTLMGLFFMAMFEDVIFFISLAFHYGYYPYPADNWWVVLLATFRVLGDLGQAIPFFPYVPLYYLPGFAMVFTFYGLALYKQEAGRVASWIFGALFLGIIIGTFYNNDVFAIIVVSLIPLVSYGTITYRAWRRKNDNQPIFFEK